MELRHSVTAALILCVLAGPAAIVASASSPSQIDWIRQFGTAANDIAVSVATDGTSAYVVGTTLGVLSSADGHTQWTSGKRDAFIRKYDAAGHKIWTRQFGSSENDSVTYVAVDHQGGVYVVGTGGAAFGDASEAGAFVRKYNAAGKVRWTREFNASGPIQPGVYAQANAVSSDGASGDVFVVGQVLGGAALPGETSSTGSRDAFVRKYDSAGNAAWTHQFGATSSSPLAIARATAVDPLTGGVYVGGYFQGQLLKRSVVEQSTAFLRKYDAAGNEWWTTTFGTPTNTFLDDVSADAAGNVYAGGVVGSGDALPGQKSAGCEDAFVRKYAAGGRLIWTRQFGSSADDSVMGVSADSLGRGVYVGGRTFANSCGGVIVPNADPDDAIVRGYDSDGNELWRQQFGTDKQDDLAGVASHGSEVYIAGTTDGALEGPSSGLGGLDAFMAKITVPASVVATPGVLWPPNHQMVAVSVVVDATDLEDPSPTCAITSVASNEPVVGLDKGDAGPDWEITGALTVNLRAERADNGTGRIYTLTVTCTDAAGVATAKTTTVIVPHDMRK